MPTPLTTRWFTSGADFGGDRIPELQQVAITGPRFNNAELDAEKGKCS